MPRMRLTLAELLDRWTIELRKAYYGHENQALMSDVYHEVWGQVANMISNGGKPADAVVNAVVSSLLATARLGIVNADIGSCEWQIRAGRQLSLEDLGQRAVVTRKLNDYRSEIKQCLSAALEQNVETRYYGFGKELDPEKMSMEVQEPVKFSSLECEI